MAGKRLLITIIVIAAALTAAALQYKRIADSAARQEVLDDRRFVKTYVELATARESFNQQPDSLEAIFDGVFSENETDSIWMRQYLRTIGDDLNRHHKIWEEIIDSLNEVKNNSKR